MDRYHDHPEWHGLCAAVRATPDDDLPRLVAADWLEEHRQPERAEFIRVQVELEKPGRDGMDYLRMRRRERELWLLVGDEVKKPLDDWPATVPSLQVAGLSFGGREALIVRRGLVAEVRCRMADWIGGECPECQRFAHTHVYPELACVTCRRQSRVTGIGPAVVAVHPVEKVSLIDQPNANFTRGHGGRWNISGRLLLPDGGFYSPPLDVWFASVEIARKVWEDWLSDTLIAWAKSVNADNA